MSNKKKLFTTLSTLTVGVVAGSAIALSPLNAVANEHEGEGKCKTEKTECKCEGTKKADCEKEHAGEHSCKAQH